MSNQSIISLEKVGKSYGSYQVLSNISMKVNQGEIVALLGQTGAGKSTVMNMVMGTQPTSAGTVRVAGYDPFRDFAKLRGKMAVSFQTDRLLPWRTAVENCELGLLILKVPPAEARKRALTWLSRVKLEGAADKHPHELSGGMRQRVSLARALCVDPQLVLLDESFSQLDHVTSKELRQDFARVVREYNKTCLFVTHRIDDAIEMADRVIVLRPNVGVALEENISAEVCKTPELAQALHDRIAACMAGETQ
ncbi:ABC transporter ATP-binding protein [Pseudochrobactrum asaccharolyticum]|uniref:NitT/TauT family transport system ATP-binding protein n=1 Tax=Pseudochrobactrum asaccharolyticum TaxID=354351 RepID=A0A366DME7_9HYPH|nr:ATP-binding cassette domain-containing protein [Pseudochrobactrum asaccharolyticum]MBX8802366.1 ATP-binding cassette domain-containing protein [Ochrobactrum sp. MR28]MBX8817884.1 ATP-binding cassette domain-containing protein [Ochrobactrum sp. MR31]RBO90408.1 NitT/TauT family transport system ATP-binding protein [Pseudochrobactrum asaccharolyticum]